MKKINIVSSETKKLILEFVNPEFSIKDYTKRNKCKIDKIKYFKTLNLLIIELNVNNEIKKIEKEIEDIKMVIRNLNLKLHKSLISNNYKGINFYEDLIYIQYDILQKNMIL